MLTTASAVTLLTFFTTTFFGVHLGPYVGILAVLVLPARLRPRPAAHPARHLAPPPARAARRARCRPTIRRSTSGGREIRETLLFVVVMSGVNVALFLGGDLPGRPLHGVGRLLRPDLPHGHAARVHVARGRRARARARASTATSGRARPGSSARSSPARTRCWRSPSTSIPRPIPVPIENLRPSRDTCEQCHWPEQLRRRQAPREDPLRRRGDGGRDEDRPPHAHRRRRPAQRAAAREPRRARPARAPRSTTGRATRRRQDIPYVRYRRPDGEVVEYVVTPKGKPPAAASRPGRRSG